MRAAQKRDRGPIWGEFTRVQNGQAIDHLARAFHLPRPQAKVAILEMLSALSQRFDEQTLSRPTLARLVELLAKNNYEYVLDDPILLGATSTQVIGNEALTAVAGHSESVRIANRAAAAAGISEMIAEYLLPVVAAMFMGALSMRTRASLLALARREAPPVADYAPPASTASGLLPVGRGSSGVFSGSTVVSPSLAPEHEALYRELAERIRKAGDEDPLGSVRRIIAEGLGVRERHAPWLTNAQKWVLTNFGKATTQMRERLRSLRSR